MLTARQKKLYEFIDARIQATGVAPTYTEMYECLGYQGRASVQNMVGRLVERGYLRKLPHRARAIEVIKRRVEYFRFNDITKEFEPLP